MNQETRAQLRALIQELLVKHGDHEPVQGDDSLFLSSRLDSLSMINLIMHLEKTYGVDFAEEDFEVELIDTLDDIEKMLRRLNKG